MLFELRPAVSEESRLPFQAPTGGIMKVVFLRVQGLGFGVGEKRDDLPLSQLSINPKP